jgi:hypothetical protein
MKEMRKLILVVGLNAVVALPPGAPSAESLRELAFVRGEGSESEICVVREDRSRLRRITNNRRLVTGAEPDWRPVRDQAG